ncbi:MAG: hypothetical protein J6T51_02940, partial [Kiritimatiellae bacterium]|nr:hypothetical protein [Kiritimatiellia bacterium]
TIQERKKSMTTGKALNGKPYAGNPHVRFDEGEVASAATPRRGSLLYSYVTVGTIKSLNLSDHTFKLDPISKYRFEVKDGDEGAWKIIFKETSILEGEDPTSLQLLPQCTLFKFKGGLDSAMIVLKQSKAHVRIAVQIEEKRARRNAPTKMLACDSIEVL